VPVVVGAIGGGVDPDDAGGPRVVIDAVEQQQLDPVACFEKTLKFVPSLAGVAPSGLLLPRSRDRGTPLRGLAIARIRVSSSRPALQRGLAGAQGRLIRRRPFSEPLIVILPDDRESLVAVSHALGMVKSIGSAR
jgi:hypothetical protein